MLAKETKKIIRAEANRLGFELVWSDLRTGCFHIKRGTTVRRGHVWRNIDPAGIADQVKTVSQYGDRLDTIRGSSYYTQQQEPAK